MSMTTRLVVLGAVHQFQPVHGYFLRRELVAWHVDQWANIGAGSIYNALRSLTADGYLAENGTEAAGNRPERTTYRMTAEGDVELLRMLRETLWNVQVFDTKPVMVLTSFMYALPRKEVLSGLLHRASEIDARIASNNYRVGDVAHSKSTPNHVRETFELATARLRGEQQWARDVSERIRAGDYVFANEDGDQRTGTSSK
jgi:DNA-binding PadR family transcriptional regulator